MVTLPIILSIYISTVYGRFHYTSDVPAGILTAVFALWVSPKLQRVWKGARIIFEIKRIPEPTLVAEDVREEE
jgi:membrane-associated phospholipid phosphatase